MLQVSPKSCLCVHLCVSLYTCISKIDPPTNYIAVYLIECHPIPASIHHVILQPICVLQLITIFTITSAHVTVDPWDHTPYRMLCVYAVHIRVEPTLCTVSTVTV